MPYMRPQRPVMAPPTGGAGIMNTGSGVQREVQANELTSTHLNELTRPGAGNRYLENLRSGARQSYAARGGLNTTLAAAGAEDVGLRAAGEIAAQDAGVYSQAAGQNLDAASGREQLQMQLTTAAENRQAATAAAAANRVTDLMQRDLDRQHAMTMADRDRGWRSQEREAGERENQRTREWQSTETQRDRDFGELTQQRRNREGLGATIMQTILNNPEYMRDPNAAAGIVDFYLSEWDRWYPSQRGP